MSLENVVDVNDEIAHGCCKLQHSLAISLVLLRYLGVHVSVALRKVNKVNNPAPFSDRRLRFAQDLGKQNQVVCRRLSSLIAVSKRAVNQSEARSQVA